MTPSQARDPVIPPALLADLPANVGTLLREFVQVLLQSADQV
jgi:hypothetical protein